VTAVATPTTRVTPLAVPGGLPPRRVPEALFPGATVRYVHAWEAVADAFDRLGDQRPATCGAYAARYLLAPLGYVRHDGIDTSREDYLAFLAGTVVEAYEVEPAERVRAAVAAAGWSDEEALRRHPREFYAWTLRSSDDRAVAGTSPTGTARAVAVASRGALATLPVPARSAGGEVLLTGERWERLWDLVADRLEAWRVHPIANYETDQLLAPTDPAYSVEGLRGAAVESLPRDRWEVGHFAGIGAFWRDGERRWVLLLDTYKARGFRGYEPQPAELLRRGLVREDGREGGLLLVIPREHLGEARAAVEVLGLEIRMWGNGSLEPEGWAWDYGR